MENKPEEFMREAVRLSIKNVDEKNGGPFGAVVVKDGKIIERGVNNVTSHNDPTAHAEMVAIREACADLKDYQLTGCVIYCSCEPCPMCLGAIYWARPEKVFYASTKIDAATAGFDDDFIYDEIKLDPASRKIPMVYFSHPEPIRIFNEWKEKDDKIAY